MDEPGLFGGGYQSRTRFGEWNWLLLEDIRKFVKLRKWMKNECGKNVIGELWFGWMLITWSINFRYNWGNIYRKQRNLAELSAIEPRRWWRAYRDRLRKCSRKYDWALLLAEQTSGAPSRDVGLRARIRRTRLHWSQDGRKDHGQCLVWKTG